MLGYILSSLSIHTVALLDYPVVPIYWPNLPDTREHAFGLIGPLAGSEIFRRSISLYPYPTMGELLPSQYGLQGMRGSKGYFNRFGQKYTFPSSRGYTLMPMVFLDISPWSPLRGSLAVFSCGEKYRKKPLGPGYQKKGINFGHKGMVFAL